MIDRLLRKSDFERVLAVPPCSRSAHFAVHYLPERPSVPVWLGIDILSTGNTPKLTLPVDNLVSGHWLGNIMPKRYAARSVTRNMLRRQVRAAMQKHVARLRPGLWLVRLRQPFPKTAFVSAESAALRSAASAELERRFEHACS
jgi:ribonuclease P protein component